jgi:DNA-binding NarL/FixJ family response regulator
LSGAAECLDKGCTPQELVAAVRQARALPRPGTTRQGTGLATAGGDYGAAIERAATRGGLTEREKAVVCQIVIAEQSNKEIAQTLSRSGTKKLPRWR